MIDESDDGYLGVPNDVRERMLSRALNREPLEYAKVGETPDCEHLKILLDGQEAKWVVEAKAGDPGWLIWIARGADGKPKVNEARDGIEFERKTGHVELIWISPP